MILVLQRLALVVALGNVPHVEQRRPAVELVCAHPKVVSHLRDGALTAVAQQANSVSFELGGVLVSLPCHVPDS